MDRERDKRIAEALGWTNIQSPTWEDGRDLIGDHPIRPAWGMPDFETIRVPDYSEPAAAFSLLEELLKRGWAVSDLQHGDIGNDRSFYITVRYCSRSVEEELSGKGDSLADAIANAAEKALGE